MLNKKWLIFSSALLLLASLAMVLIACGSSALSNPSPSPAISNLSVAQAYDLIKSQAGKSDFQIIDVRTPAEYQAGHLAGALNIDIYSADFQSRLKQLDKNARYLVYCRSGARSAQASQNMADLGFSRINNMLGGINDWTSAGYPVSN